MPPSKLTEILSKPPCLDAITLHLLATTTRTAEERFPVPPHTDLVNLALTNRSNLAALKWTQGACWLQHSTHAHPFVQQQNQGAASILAPCNIEPQPDGGPSSCGKLICNACASPNHPAAQAVLEERWRPACSDHHQLLARQRPDGGDWCQCRFEKYGDEAGGRCCPDCRRAKLLHARRVYAAKTDCALEEPPYPACLLPCGRLIPEEVGRGMYRAWKDAKLAKLAEEEADEVSVVSVSEANGDSDGSDLSEDGNVVPGAAAAGDISDVSGGGWTDDSATYNIYDHVSPVEYLDTDREEVIGGQKWAISYQVEKCFLCWGWRVKVLKNAVE